MKAYIVVDDNGNIDSIYNNYTKAKAECEELNKYRIVGGCGGIFDDPFYKVVEKENKE